MDGIHDPQELLTLDVVAALLKCCRQSLYTRPYFRTRMVRLGKRSTRIPRAAVIAYLAMQGRAA